MRFVRHNVLRVLCKVSLSLPTHFKTFLSPSPSPSLSLYLYPPLAFSFSHVRYLYRIGSTHLPLGQNKKSLMENGMLSVWPAVLRALRSRGLEFEDVQLAEDGDRDDILREIFPNAPLYRAYAGTMWIRLSRIIAGGQGASQGEDTHIAPQQQQQQQQQPPQQQDDQLSSLDIWTAFLSALSYKDLSFEEVKYAQLDDRWAMLQEVFPHNPLWRAQACSFWEQLCSAHAKEHPSPTAHSPAHAAMYTPPPINPQQLQQ